MLVWCRSTWFRSLLPYSKQSITLTGHWNVPLISWVNLFCWQKAPPSLKHTNTWRKHNFRSLDGTSTKAFHPRTGLPLLSSPVSYCWNCNLSFQWERKYFVLLKSGRKFDRLPRGSVLCLLRVSEWIFLKVEIRELKLKWSWTIILEKKILGVVVEILSRLMKDDIRKFYGKKMLQCYFRAQKKAFWRLVF